MSKPTRQPIALPPLAPLAASSPAVPVAGDSTPSNGTITVPPVAIASQQPAFIEVHSLPNGRLQYRPKQFHPKTLPIPNLTVAMGDDDSDERKTTDGPPVNDKAMLVGAFLRAKFEHMPVRGMVVLGMSRHKEYFQSIGINGGYIHPTWDDKTQKQIEEFITDQERRVQVAKIDPSITCATFLVFHDLSENHAFTHSKLLQRVISNMDTLQLHVFITVTRPMALPPEIRQAVKCLAVHRQNSVHNLDRMWHIWFSKIPYHHFEQMVEQITQSSPPRALIWDAYKHEIRWFDVVSPGKAPSAAEHSTVAWGEPFWHQYGKEHYLNPTKSIALTHIRELTHQAQLEMARTEHYVHRMQQLPTFDKRGRELLLQEWASGRPSLPSSVDLHRTITALAHT